MYKSTDTEVTIKKSSVDFLLKYIELYRICFPNATHLGAVYLSWLYKANPAGGIVGADAFFGNEVIGQVVAVPGEYFLSGRLVRGLLAVNVVVHPKFQGRHLFKKLGLKMCEYGAEAGYEFVIGVANAVATPGWVRQMGFQLVQPLEARLGVGSLGIDFGVAEKMVQFKREWTEESLSWRIANPNNPVAYRKKGDRLQFYAAAKGKFLPVYAELPVQPASSLAVDRLDFLSPCRLFLGLVPNDACNFSSYIDIPQCFRPSPLNFIYRSLTQRVVKLEKGSVSFSFLDFDAY